MGKRKAFHAFRRCVLSLETVISRQSIHLGSLQKYLLREWHKQADRYWRYYLMNKNLFYDSYLIIKDFYLMVCDTYSDYMLSALSGYLDCIIANEESTPLIQHMLEQDEKHSRITR